MASGKASTPAKAAPSTAAGFQTWSHRFACGLARPQPAPAEAPPNHGSASMGRPNKQPGTHTRHVRNAISAAAPGNMLGRTSFKRAISACGSADASCATRKQHVSPLHEQGKAPDTLRLGVHSLPHSSSALIKHTRGSLASAATVCCRRVQRDWCTTHAAARIQ